MQREAGQQPVLAEPPPPALCCRAVTPPSVPSCFPERQVRWLQRQDLHRHRDIFGKAAVSALQEVGIDLVAGPDPGDAAADRLHLPDSVDTEDLLLGRSNPGWPVRTGLAAQGIQVRGIDRYPSTFTRTSPASARAG